MRLSSGKIMVSRRDSQTREAKKALVRLVEVVEVSCLVILKLVEVSYLAADSIELRDDQTVHLCVVGIALVFVPFALAGPL